MSEEKVTQLEARPVGDNDLRLGCADNGDPRVLVGQQESRVSVDRMRKLGYVYDHELAMKEISKMAKSLREMFA